MHHLPLHEDLRRGLGVAGVLHILSIGQIQQLIWLRLRHSSGSRLGLANLVLPGAGRVVGKRAVYETFAWGQPLEIMALGVPAFAPGGAALFRKLKGTCELRNRDPTF